MDNIVLSAPRRKCEWLLNLARLARLLVSINAQRIWTCRLQLANGCLVLLIWWNLVKAIRPYHQYQMSALH